MNAKLPPPSRYKERERGLADDRSNMDEVPELVLVVGGNTFAAPDLDRSAIRVIPAKIS